MVIVKCTSLTHLRSLVFYYTPWKHQKTWFSNVFRGYRMRLVVWNRLSRSFQIPMLTFSSRTFDQDDRIKELTYIVALSEVTCFYMILRTENWDLVSYKRKQSPRDFLRKGYSEKFHQIHRKTPVTESLF